MSSSASAHADGYGAACLRMKGSPFILDDRRCPCCGYDLKSGFLRDDSCPECGADAATRDDRRSPHWLLAMSGVPFVAFVSVWSLVIVWTVTARILNPGDPERGISPMGPETTERYVAWAAVSWAYSWPAILSLAGVLAMSRRYPTMPGTFTWLTRSACALACITALSGLVADGTSDSSTTVLGLVGNVFIADQACWMAVALSVPVALFAPRRVLRMVGWACVAFASLSVLISIRYEVRVFGLASRALSHDTWMLIEEWMRWATHASAVGLALVVLWCFVRIRPGRSRQALGPLPMWMRAMAAIGWCLAVLLPLSWWAIRAPLAGLGYPESTWFVLMGRWIVTFLAASAWVISVLLAWRRLITVAWVAAACAATLSVLLLAGRSAPESAPPPWTLPEIEFEDEPDEWTVEPMESGT